IDIGTRRGLEGDLPDATFDGGCVVVAFDVFAANHVEDDVGAAVAGCLFGRGDEIFGLVVNGDIGPERDASGAFFRRSCRGMRRARNVLASWMAVVPMPEDPP